jgi:pyruvate formate lyase activating enzyme
LFHFYPGSFVLSLGTLGCNFKCPGCQNFDISHNQPDENSSNLQKLSPFETVELAKKYNADGICWTYNEPAIWFEQTLETAILAKKAGLYTAYITNGYITPEALDLIGPYLDAYRVDIKGFSKESYRKITKLSSFEGILEVTKRARFKWRMHVECVTNVTPTINDSDEILEGIARWIANELGYEIHWHVTRFFPYLDLEYLYPTPVGTLFRAYEIGKKAGLKFVYIGNLPGNETENTYCPKCGKVVIKRNSYSVMQVNLRDNLCSFCGELIYGVGFNFATKRIAKRIPIIYI